MFTHDYIYKRKAEPASKAGEIKKQNLTVVVISHYEKKNFAEIT